MEAHGAIWTADHRKGQVATCPICCDSTLDDEEIDYPVCGCGFQLCSFCLNKIQTESDNTCPHCRTSYEEGPQEELYARLSKLVEQRNQAEKEARASAVQNAHQQTASANLQIPTRPAAPTPNLNLEEESIWPGLAPSPKPAKPPIHKKPVSAPPPEQPSTAAAPPQQTFNFPLLAVSETPLYPLNTSEWDNNNAFPSNPTSSAPTASGTETPSSPSPSPSPGNGSRPVMVRYHGATSGVLSTIDPVYASGRCLVNISQENLTASAMNSAGLLNLESAALLNSIKEALRGGKVTVQGAATALIQYLEHSKNISNTPHQFVDTIGAGMMMPFKRQDDAALFNNNIGGDRPTESLFAGMSLLSSDAPSSLSMPPGFSFSQSHTEFGGNVDNSNIDSGGAIGAGGGGVGLQRGAPPGFQSTGFVYQ